MIKFACKPVDKEELIKCSLALSKSDYSLFLFLLENPEAGYTVKSLADSLNLDRTTIQKSVKKLLEKSVIHQYQENLSPGGYRFIYKIKEREAIKKNIYDIINEWNSNVLKIIENW